MGSIRTTWKEWGGGGTSITSFPAPFSNWPWNETVTPDFTVTATEMLLLLYSCYHQSNLVAQRNYSFFLDPSKRPFLCRLQKYTIGSTNSFQFQIPAMMGSWVVAWEGASTSVANYQQPVLTLFLSLSPSHLCTVHSSNDLPFLVHCLLGHDRQVGKSTTCQRSVVWRGASQLEEGEKRRREVDSYIVERVTKPANKVSDPPICGLSQLKYCMLSPFPAGVH